jgi:hypothetical protein
MPKIAKISSKYIVSVIYIYDDFEFNDRPTADWEGDDIDKLADEVCKSDPDHLMYFRRNTNTKTNKNTIGWFYSIDDKAGEYHDAEMLTTNYYYELCHSTE